MQILRTFVGQHGQWVALTEPLQVGQVGCRLDRDLQRHGDYPQHAQSSASSTSLELYQCAHRMQKTYRSDWFTRLNLALVNSLLALICKPFPASHVSKVKTTQIFSQRIAQKQSILIDNNAHLRRKPSEGRSTRRTL